MPQGPPAPVPIASVIMVVRNVAPFVLAAVRSALAQTLREIEVLLLDDGSDDETVRIVGQVRDPRLKLVELAHEGPPAALNRGVALARGRYIGFLDGDDIWAAGKLERHVEVMEANPSLDCTFSLSRLIDEDGADLGVTSRAANGPVTYERILIDNMIANGSSVVVRRSALLAAGPFDTTLRGAYDFDVWLRLARQRPGNVRCLPEILTFYRRRTGQITKNRDLMAEAWRKVFEKHRQADPATVEPLRSKAHSNLYRYLAALSYERREFGEGMRLMARSMRADPLHFLLTRRSYFVTAALMGGVLLPEAPRRGLQRIVRRMAAPVRIPASGP